MNSLTRYTSVPKATRSQLDFILLDASGSMRDKWYDSLAAIDAYVLGLKHENVNSHIMLRTFTSTGGMNAAGDYAELHVEHLCRDEPISAYVPLHQQPVGADFGGTPLYDAIRSMGLFARESDPPRAAFTIVTDGDEAGSTHTTLDQARAILDWMRAKGWQVTFIGCDFDNTRIARLLGAAKGSSIGVSKANLQLATRALAKKRAAYGLYGTDMHYTDDENAKFGGYLGHG